MKVVVGLGNPGKKYDLTRHNIGFMMIDHFSQQYNASFKFDKKFNADICELNIDGEKVLLVKPLTFMNLSGDSVRKIMDYYHVDLDNLLVCHDDMAINFGQIKFKYNSSSGGQNGIKNIINHLGSQAFLRIKFGILNSQKTTANEFVLGKFNRTEQQQLKEMLTDVDQMIDGFISGMNRNDLMNKYN